MKILKLIPFILLISFSSCKKDCESNIPQCEETPPTNEVCLAYFNRWFYDAGSDSCELIGYSGCEQYGFATKEECEACKCD